MHRVWITEEPKDVLPTQWCQDEYLQDLLQPDSEATVGLDERSSVGGTYLPLLVLLVLAILAYLVFLL